eukprot:Gb_05087 [translate_table: standard]
MLQHHSEDGEPALVTTYASHKGGTYCLAFRPYMKHLVSGGADGAVLLWSLFCRPNAHTRHTQIRPYRYLGHQGAVYAVAVSPQDTVVASSSKDKTVRLWLPTAEGKCSVIKGHGGAIRTVAFSSDGKCLLTGSDDKTIKVWSVDTEKFLLTLNGHMNWVRSAEFNGDGRLVASGGDDKTVKLWDVEKHECIHTFNDIIGMVNCTRFSPDGACVGSCGSDRSIQIRDIRSRILIQHYAGNAGAVMSICFHPSGSYLLSTCEDSTVKIWDLREGRILCSLQGHERSTTCAQYSPTGEHFASGSMDEHVMIWRSELKPVGNLCSGSLASAMKKHFTSLMETQPLSILGSREDQGGYNSQFKLPGGSPTPEKEKELETVPLQPETQLKNIEVKHNSDKLDDVDVGDLLARMSGSPGSSFPVDSPKKRKVLDDDDSKQVKISGVSLPSQPIVEEIKTIEFTLQRVVSQMDVLTRTISLFEERLSQTEDKVMRLEKNVTQNNRKA